MIQPLLPLSVGHLALCLSAGMLDGRLTLADGSTVVLRAVSSKTEYNKSDTAEIRGGVTFRAVVTGERPCLRIRVLYPDGRLVDFT